MLKTTKLMDALWSSRNRVWGVWAHSAFVLCEKKYGWNWQIGGTTCAINYYLSNVSSILCGVWGICITFELPEVQLIHELVHPDDDCNSCSFFGNLFVAKHANLSEMKGEISGPPSFWMVKIPPTCPSAIPGNSTWRCFTQPMAKKIHQVLSLSASQCVERRAGAIELSYRFFLVLGTTWSGLGNQFLVMDEIWTNPRHFIGLESAISLEPGRWTIVGLCRENKLRCQFESLLSGYVPSGCG